MQLTFRFGRIVLPLLILSPSYSAFLLDPKQTVSGRRTRSWAPEELPRPESSDCRSGDSDRFCDPDSILLKADNAILGEVLKDSQTRMVTLAPSCTKEPSKLHLSSEVQFSVVILKKVR